MQRLIHIGIETAKAAVFLLPILLLENKLVFKSIKKTICYSVFALYLCAVFAAVGIPSILYIRFNMTINMVPFIPMMDDLKNSVLNVLLFIPLGILLPYLWERFASMKRVILTGLGLSLFIELLQIFTYRATDINDLITNSLGAALGYGIVKIFLKKQRLITPAKDSVSFYIVSITAFAVMFFMQPFILPMA